MFIPFGPWTPDAGAHVPGAVTDAKNVLPSASGYRNLGNWSIITGTTALAARCQGAASFVSRAGVAQNFAGDAAALYRQTSATWTDESKAGGYTTAANDFWEFAAINNVVIAVNNSTASGDPPQAWDMATSTDFADLGGSPPNAKHIAIIGQFVVLGNTWDATDGVRENRVRWSAIGDETDWTVAAATQADFNDLPEGVIVHRIIGGERYGLVYTSAGIYRMTYVGSPVIFDFDLIDREVGTTAPQSVVAQGDDVYFLGTDGFRVTPSGGPSVKIGAEKFDKWFRESAQENAPHGIIGVVDPENNVVMWTFPTSTTAGTTTLGIALNYVTGEGARLDFSDDSDEVEYWWWGLQLNSVFPDRRVMMFQGDAANDHKVGFLRDDNARRFTLITHEFELAEGRAGMISRVTPVMSKISTTGGQDGDDLAPFLKVHYRDGVTSPQTSTDNLARYAPTGLPGGDYHCRIQARLFRIEINTDAGSGSGYLDSIRGVNIDESAVMGIR